MGSTGRDECLFAFAQLALLVGDHNAQRSGPDHEAFRLVQVDMRWWISTYFGQHQVELDELPAGVGSMLAKDDPFAGKSVDEHVRSLAHLSLLLLLVEPR
jgi:hypothetical protein